MSTEEKSTVGKFLLRGRALEGNDLTQKWYASLLKKKKNQFGLVSLVL